MLKNKYTEMQNKLKESVNSELNASADDDEQVERAMAMFDDLEPQLSLLGLPQDTWGIKKEVLGEKQIRQVRTLIKEAYVREGFANR